MAWRRRQRYHRGEYRADDHELYQVEELHGSRAFIENCRTGELLDVELSELDRLRPVRAAVDSWGGSPAEPAAARR